MRPTLEELETFLQANMPHSEVIAHENFTELLPKGLGVCDFCSTPNTVPAHRFEVPNFIVESEIIEDDDFTRESIGAWGACPSCEKFVLADDDAGLIEHCLPIYMKGFPGFDRKLLKKELTALQRPFWKAYRARLKT